MMRTKSIVFLLFFFASTWTTSAALMLFSVPVSAGAASTPRAPPASTTTKNQQGTRSRRQRPIIQKLFDNADTNHDGSISRDEAYILVLKWYIKINQSAPIQPPSRQTVNQLFDLMDTNHHDRITIDEFGNFAAMMWRRALVRVVAHKLVTIVGAPLLAGWIVAQVSQHAQVVASLQTMCKKIVPARFLPTVTTKAFGRTVLMISFCVTLGNFVMSRVNEVQAFWLHYQARRNKAMQEKKENKK